MKKPIDEPKQLREQKKVDKEQNEIYENLYSSFVYSHSEEMNSLIELLIEKEYITSEEASRIKSR